MSLTAILFKIVIKNENIHARYIKYISYDFHNNFVNKMVSKIRKRHIPQSVTFPKLIPSRPRLCASEELRFWERSYWGSLPQFYRRITRKYIVEPGAPLQKA